MQQFFQYFMSKKKATEDDSTPATPFDGPNPYLNARREHNDVTGSIIVQRNLWIAAAFFFGCIGLASVGGLIYVAAQSKFIPYIVEVDKLGQAANAGVAQQTSAVDPKITKAIVSAYISDYQLVTIDISLQTKAIERVYAFMVPGDPAYVKAGEKYNNERLNPFKRAATETTSIKIESILQQTANSWQVDWIETVRDRKGVLKEPPFMMRAIVTTEQFPHDEMASDKSLTDNPLGVYIVDHNMQRVLQ